MTRINPPLSEEMQPVLDRGGHAAPITIMFFTPDGRRLVSASNDGTIRVWDVAKRKPIRVIYAYIMHEEDERLCTIALSPDGKWLAAAINQSNGRRTVIHLYDFSNVKRVGLLQEHEGEVYRLAFSPDGRLLIAGGDSHSASVWDVAARTIRHRLDGHDGAISAVGFTPDGSRAVTASHDRRLRIWSAEDGAALAILPDHKAEVVSLAIASNGAMASCDEHGEIRLWEAQTGKFIKTLSPPRPWCGVLAFSPDGARLLATYSRGPIDQSMMRQHVYDVASGHIVSTYHDHESLVFAAAISPDGHTAATGGDRDIHLWNTRPGARRKKIFDEYVVLLLGNPWRRVIATAFSANGDDIGWGKTNPIPPSFGFHSPEGMPPENNRGPIQFAMRLPQAQKEVAAPRQLWDTSAYLLGEDNDSSFVRAIAQYSE